MALHAFRDFQRLQLKYDNPLSNVDFNFNRRPCSKAVDSEIGCPFAMKKSSKMSHYRFDKVGRRSFTPGVCT